MHIAEAERGVFRLFHIGLPASEIDGFFDVDSAAGTVALQEALGVRSLDMAHVQRLDLAALKPLGLSTFLEEGLGVARADFEHEIARLDALGGHAVAIGSGAFTPGAVLHPKPPLSLIGVYAEDRPAPRFEPLPEGGASGHSSPVTSSQPAPRGSALRVMLILLVIITVVYAVFKLFGSGAPAS